MLKRFKNSMHCRHSVLHGGGVPRIKLKKSWNKGKKDSLILLGQTLGGDGEKSQGAGSCWGWWGEEGTFVTVIVPKGKIASV